MKEREMKIGNWAMGNKPFQITAEDIVLAEAHEKLTSEERWDGVLLTDEWLIKFGFEVKTT